MRKTLIALFLFLITFGFVLASRNNLEENVLPGLLTDFEINEGGPETDPHPLSIDALRQGEYPGSEIIIQQTLATGSNYQKYIASYKSEGLKIFGLLTIPNGNIPEKGWPAIIFNHGYISPTVYKTTEKYVSYQNAFARAGYVTFKSDYRGHGNSEGEARGGYGSNGYTIDVLNAVSSVQKMEEVNSEKIGMWGHSMGGHITLESMVVSGDIKAGVIWAGVVGSYEDLYDRWRHRRSSSLPSNIIRHRGRWRQDLAEQFGDPINNPDFWNGISAINFIDEISGPVQLHHATTDTRVPIEFSDNLNGELEKAGKEVEYFTYEGDDHNLSNNLSSALRRSVEFFDRYLK